FLFKGEDIDKKVAVLSGGERSRLALARLMLHPYNLLALDEPTNHMDIRSKDVLKQALLQYDGTLVVVSHDRDFLDGLVDKVYEFGDRRVKEHLGGINDFLRRKKMAAMEEIESVRRPAAPEADTKERPVSDSRMGREAFKQQSRIANKIKSVEKQIAEIESQMKELETHLEAPEPSDDIMELTRRYLELKRSLDLKMDEWTALNEQ
ncbi:MAG: ABC-F family ATP-binding cassette domain-containing protein, partial [Bacteroidales bacterium]|nr:ABC-F family ATP-binding cassette domain-containing protein [Bacteroidales bacterium]